MAESRDNLSVISRLGLALNRCNFPSFYLKPLQLKYFEHLLNGYDVIAVLPTGFGKSLLFQLLSNSAEIVKMIATARLCSLFLVFLCNALMWTLFVKSLRKCGSSAEATVTNSASNFVCTAILGQVIFGERSSLQWWLGISMVLSGLILIHFSNEKMMEIKMIKLIEQDRS